MKIKCGTHSNAIAGIKGLIVVGVFLVFTDDLRGQRLDEPPNDKAVITADKRQGPITLDGKLTEKTWNFAVDATEFVQKNPVEGAQPSVRTDVSVLFDDHAIYIGAKLHDTTLSIADQLVRRDGAGQYDYFQVSIDPYHNKRSGYRFRVSASGVQWDSNLYNDDEQDRAWDAVWQSAVLIDSTGWSVEMKIPLSQIRYKRRDDIQTWGINFTRRRLSTNELLQFSLVSDTRSGVVSQFGDLQGILIDKKVPGIEFRPYTSLFSHFDESIPGDPFFDGSEYRWNAGGELRYRLGSTATLDATFNPDFGQVEVDPAVINLTAFETFFPEKRPFFVQNAQIFDFGLIGGNNRLFYSRRIGERPGGRAPSEAEFVQKPEQTTIIGAGKLTGRNDKNLSYGALSVVTAREEGHYLPENSDHIQSFIAAPARFYNVVGLSKEYREGKTFLKGVGATMHREKTGETSLNDRISASYSAGIRWEHNWGGSRSRDWQFWGFLAGSHIRGPSESLVRIQRDINHNFQRPDDDEVRVDSSATSMSGTAWQLEIMRNGDPWFGKMWLVNLTPGFEVNETGFTQQAERFGAGGMIGYQEVDPIGIFQNYELRLTKFNNWRNSVWNDPFSFNAWKKGYRSNSIVFNAGGTFRNYWGGHLRLRYAFETLSDTKTRGGPLMTDPPLSGIDINLNTDRRKPVTLSSSFGYEHRYYGGYSWDVNLGISGRPTSSVELSLTPRLAKEHDPAQYVTTSPDLNYEPTYGRQYIFSDLYRTTVALQGRVNKAFSKDLSLQLFLQPLISSGDYRSYKRLRWAESFEFDYFVDGTGIETPAGIVCSQGSMCVRDGRRYFDTDDDQLAEFSVRDRDFNTRILKVNAVLRWEYRPGSTFYLVWQQNRFSRIMEGTFNFGDNLADLGNIYPENIFIIKIDYWFGL